MSWTRSDPAFEDLLLSAHREAFRFRFAEAAALLGAWQPAPDSRPGDVVAVRALALSLALRRRASLGAEALVEVLEIDAEARRTQDPVAIVEVRLLQSVAQDLFGLPSAAVAELVEAVDLCQRFGLDGLLGAVVANQCQKLGRGGLWADVVVQAQRWLAHQPPLGDEAQALLWNTLGTAEYFLAEEESSPGARERSLEAHLRSFELALATENPVLAGAEAQNLAIGYALSGNEPRAREYLALTPVAQTQSPEANAQLRAWNLYCEGVLLFAQGRPQPARELLAQGIEVVQPFRSPSRGVLIQLHQQLLKHPDPALEGADLRAWAQELVRLYREQNRQQQELSSKGFQEMVRSLEVTGQNRLLRVHTDDLTQELAQRNEALQRARDELEDRVAARTAELSQAQARLAHQQRMATVSQLVAGVAHRLNTPLGNARLAVSSVAEASDRFLKMLERPMARKDLIDLVRITGEASAYADQALARASELMHLFKQVSSLENSDEATGYQPVEVVRFVAHQVGESHPSVPLHLDLAPVPRCHGHPLVLGQVLERLVVNAVVHGQPASGEGGVWVRLTANGSDLVLTVEDRGPGIAEADRGRIFEPFNANLSGPGLGLGLHIARNLTTDLLRGEITVTGAEGGGSLFLLRFPSRA